MQAKSVAGFASAVQKASETNPAILSARKLQNADVSAEIVVEKNIGRCFCIQDSSDSRYPFNPSGGVCGCGR